MFENSSRSTINQANAHSPCFHVYPRNSSPASLTHRISSTGRQRLTLRNHARRHHLTQHLLYKVACAELHTSAPAAVRSDSMHLLNTVHWPQFKAPAPTPAQGKTEDLAMERIPDLWPKRRPPSKQQPAMQQASRATTPRPPLSHSIITAAY